jgi:integrase
MKGFDPRTAKQLPAGQHILIDGAPGLRLSSSATRKTWTYRYRTPEGRLGQTKVGTWPEMSVAAAVAAWEKLRVARDAGADPAAERRTARTAALGDATSNMGKPTVADVLRDYVSGHVNISRKEKGAAEVRRMFDKMIPDKLAAMDAASLTRRDAFDLISSHSAIPVQAAKLKAEIGAAWSMALDSGRLPDTTPNHWRDILRGKLKSTGKKIAGENIGTAKRVLNGGELGELVTWLPNFSRLVEEALTLYLWTGTRGAEIMAMMGSEAAETPAGLVWTIPKQKTKNARHANAMDLRVPLIGRAEKIVRRRMAAHGKGFLFPSEKGPGHTQQKMVSESVFFRQPYCKIRENWARTRLTVTHWGPHDLRRSARTLLAQLGCPHEIGEAIIGHMLPGVSGIYQLYKFDAERVEWLGKLSDELERLAEAHLKGLTVKPE